MYLIKSLEETWVGDILIAALATLFLEFDHLVCIEVIISKMAEVRSNFLCHQLGLVVLPESCHACIWSHSFVVLKSYVMASWVNILCYAVHRELLMKYCFDTGELHLWVRTNYVVRCYSYWSCDQRGPYTEECVVANFIPMENDEDLATRLCEPPQRSGFMWSLPHYHTHYHPSLVAEALEGKVLLRYKTCEYITRLFH